MRVCRGLGKSSAFLQASFFMPFLAKHYLQNERRESYTYDGYTDDWISVDNDFGIERVAAMGICSYRRKKE